MEDIYSVVSIGPAIAARVRMRAKELKRPLNAILADAKLGPSFIKDLTQNPNASPRVENLMKLAPALDWTFAELMNGIEGKGARGRTAIIQGDFDRRTEIEHFEATADVLKVNEYDVQLSAGPGSLITDEDPSAHWGLPRPFLESLKLEAKHLAIVSIIGESMEPLLRDGDIVMLDLRARDPSLPGIYALWEGSATVCKRVEVVHGTDPQKFRVMSVNPAYSAYEVLAEESNVIGRVAWYGRRT